MSDREYTDWNIEKDYEGIMKGSWESVGYPIGKLIEMKGWDEFWNTKIVIILVLKGENEK